MNSFSQRQGIKPVVQLVQVGDMNDELRNSLWNVLDLYIWSTSGFVYSHHGGHGEIEKFSRILWSGYFKKPVDSRPGYGRPSGGKLILDSIREYFFNCKWNEVYDFLEFVVKANSSNTPRLADYLNEMLKREFAGYKFINGIAVQITDVQESELLNEALSDSKFGLVTAHLERALQLLSDRNQPDYRNSIKESISAVECMARIVGNTPKATLGEALKILERNGNLHSSLKEGFSKLYGYTSDENGIRHAMLEIPNVNQSDAKYFLLSCTSFINYLKANLQ